MEKDYGTPRFHAIAAANLILSRAILRTETEAEIKEIEAQTNEVVARILYLGHTPCGACFRGRIRNSGGLLSAESLRRREEHTVKPLVAALGRSYGNAFERSAGAGESDRDRQVLGTSLGRGGPPDLRKTTV